MIKTLAKELGKDDGGGFGLSIQVRWIKRVLDWLDAFVRANR